MLHELAFRSMNTQIQALFESSGDIPELEERIVSWFSRSEQRFSRFRPNSELSRLNQMAGERYLISADMLQVLERSRYYMEQTEGTFSLYVHHALQKAGYDDSFERIRVKDQVLMPNQLRMSRLAEMDIDMVMQSVELPLNERVDLGGIVKGWTVQQLSAHLCSEWRLQRGLINAGGDIKVWGGAADNEPWVIAIADPFKPEAADEIRLHLISGAVATSSTRRRSWKTNEGRMHHLIDPRTMKPSTSSVIQCTVIGNDLVACEIWAKVICILGVEEGIALFEQKTEGMEAILYTIEGSIHHVKPLVDMTKGQWIGLHADFIHDFRERQVEQL